MDMNLSKLQEMVKDLETWCAAVRRGGTALWEGIVGKPRGKASRESHGSLDPGEGKRATEDEVVRWHHQFNGCEFEETPRDTERQGSLGCYSPRGHRVAHNLVTEQQRNKTTLCW